MEPSGLDPHAPTCHAVAKRTAKNSNYFIYDSFLIKLGQVRTKVTFLLNAV